jgi:hypothetical protein
MDLPSHAVVSVLAYLLPGFVAAAIVYSLTPNPRPAPFERVVQALIFTILTHAIVAVAKGIVLWFGRHAFTLGWWSDDTRVVYSVLLAIAFGLTWSKLLNNDRLHSGLRNWGITHQTSFPSEWYGAFCSNSRYVVLHLAGRRRLYGWPQEWPSSPDRGHFVIALPQWLRESDVVEVPGVDMILVKATDVQMVEFMSQLPPKELPNG